MHLLAPGHSDNSPRNYMVGFQVNLIHTYIWLAQNIQNKNCKILIDLKGVWKYVHFKL
jgi:hypothetical protein